MKCEPRYIAMKSEISANIKNVSKKLHYTLDDKKILNIRKHNETGSSLLQKLFQYAGRLVVFKV